MSIAEEKVTLRVSIDKSNLPLNFYALTSSDLRELLLAIEKSKFGGDNKAGWIIDTNQIEITASANGRANDELLDIITDVYEGFKAIEESKEDLLVMSDESKQLIRRIVGRIKRTAPAHVEAVGYEPITIESERVFALPRYPERYSAWSSIDGTLDVISVRRQPYFVIYEHITEHRVHCTFPDDWLDRVKDYLGYRVIAEGFIHYNREGVPISFSKPTAIERVPDAEQEDLMAYRGSMPGISGGMSSYEYIRQMREENG